MKELTLVKIPDPVLLTPCREITEVEIKSGIIDDLSIASISAQMTTIMNNNGGCGLAAPQVGLSIRLFIMNKGDKIFTAINPTLGSLFYPTQSTEGCLSIPKVKVTVPRFESCRLSCFNIAGKFVSFLLHDVEAICAQHEVDHLNGILITTKLEAK